MNKTFYNIQSLENQKECIITTDEQDAKTFQTNGFPSVFAINDNYENILGHYLELFEPLERVYLACNDLKVQNELVRRLGAEKCLIIDLCKFESIFKWFVEKKEVESLIEKAKEVKVSGIFTVEDVEPEMWESYKKGKVRGSTTYIKDLDYAWTWRGGEVNVWTGYQNEGKSLLLMQLCIIRASNENAKVAIFSPENMPMEDFFDEIIEPYIGKSSDPYYKSHQMNEMEYKLGIAFAKENFYLIYPENDFTLDTIFDKIKYLVKKQGIKTVIIDPYNTIEHHMKNGEREDLYISRFMAKLKYFAVQYKLSINLVAHQNTAKPNINDGNRYHKPSLNNIKGGGTFADKADNVLFVWRPNRAIDFSCNQVIIGSQKIKKQKLVGRPQEIGDVEFDVKTQRYSFYHFTPFTEIDRKRKEVHQVELNLIEQSSFDENNGVVNTDYIDAFENEFPSSTNEITF